MMHQGQAQHPTPSDNPSDTARPPEHAAAPHAAAPVSGVYISPRSRPYFNGRQVVDGDRPDHQCPLCGVAFARKFNLKMHVATHYPERPRVRCPLCGLSFYRHGDLARHRRAHEVGHKAHVCERCGKDFARSDRLRMHVEAGKCRGASRERRASEPPPLPPPAPPAPPELVWVPQRVGDAGGSAVVPAAAEEDAVESLRALRVPRLSPPRPGEARAGRWAGEDPAPQGQSPWTGDRRPAQEANGPALGVLPSATPAAYPVGPPGWGACERGPSALPPAAGPGLAWPAPSFVYGGFWPGFQLPSCGAGAYPWCAPPGWDEAARRAALMVAGGFDAAARN